jgi:cytochrome c-type biogenesis protein CcsB
MFNLSYFAFVAALITLALAFALHLAAAVGGRARLSFAAVGSVPLPSNGDFGLQGRPAGLLTINAFLFLSASLFLRALATGHGPFTSMFEFSAAFAWAILAFHFYFEAHYHLRMLAMLLLAVAVGLLAYATTVSNDGRPLVPALQNQVLLTVHVAVAVVAYAAFTVAFGTAVLHLVQRKDTVRWLPRSAVLDEIGYKAVLVGFPMLTLTILLGAVWAEIAWGTYWSWDPKETASLATWLVYAGYLHARLVRDWRGQRSALLLIGGFAATLFTYYGNLFLGGMHGYA